MFVSLTFVSNNGLGVCNFHLPFTAHEMENFKMLSYHIIWNSVVMWGLKTKLFELH